MIKAIQHRLFWPLFAFFLLLAFNFILSPEFFSITAKNGHLFGSLIDILMRASPLILASLGMTLVIATGGVDLSVGAIAALAPAVAVVLMQQGFTAGTAILAGLLASALVGLWNGLLISKLGLQPIIATLIAMVAGRGIAQLVVNGQIVPTENVAYSFLGSGSFLMLPFSITLAIGMIAALNASVRKTATGLFIEALGSSSMASRFVGLNTFVTQNLVYILSSVFAGFAGLLVSSNIRAVDVNNLGLYLELDAILAVVIGGTRLSGGRFSLIGSVIGALIIQTVSTTINTQGVAVESMLMVKAVVVIAVCLMQSDSLRSRLRLKTGSSKKTLEVVQPGVTP
jgi:ribose/xylose/arabinose/galactoside ABC-type transport system permease subunit